MNSNKNSRFYQFQDEGYSFDNVEILLRKINPNIFTWSQHSFTKLLEEHSLEGEFLENFVDLSISNNIGQLGEIPGIVGKNL